ncbi:hypothetical protein pdam_00008353, partial [Pocillopora damicornis]
MIKDNRISPNGDADYCLREDLKIDGFENIWVDAQDLLTGVVSNPPNRSQQQFLN